MHKAIDLGITLFDTAQVQRICGQRSWGTPPIFKAENFPGNLEIVNKLRKVAASQGKTTAQLAATWVLSNPAVTVALTGARKPSEIEENVVAGEWGLTEEVKAEILAAFE